MKLQFDPEATSWHFIHDILGQARKLDIEQLTAKHVVEAQMSIQFPDLSLPLPSCSGDVDLDNSGDLLVGNTVFHITVAPSPALYDRCRRAVLRDYSVFYSGAPPAGDRKLAIFGQCCTRANHRAIDKVVRFSEHRPCWLRFRKGKLISGFRRLLEIFNRKGQQRRD